MMKHATNNASALFLAVTLALFGVAYSASVSPTLVPSTSTTASPASVSAIQMDNDCCNH